jgi:hypothetical protein
MNELSKERTKYFQCYLRVKQEKLRCVYFLWLIAREVLATSPEHGILCKISFQILQQLKNVWTKNHSNAKVTEFVNHE